MVGRDHRHGIGDENLCSGGEVGGVGSYAIPALSSGCDARPKPSRSAPCLPFGNRGGLLARRGSEDLLQHLPLHRLLDDRHLPETAVDALHAIAGDEDERNLARHQHVGDRIDELAPEIDVDDAGVDVVVHGRDHGLRHPG